MIQNNPYEKRWRWWYSAIADWMIRNPGGSMQDCARDLDRGYNTILMITNTDMFRDYLNTRKAEWRAAHDFGIVDKLTRVAEGSLDLILDNMKKKGDQIPMKMLNEIATGTLDRLGYAPASTPAVQVNVDQRDQRKQVLVTTPVSPAALEEARDALRLAEQRRAALTIDLEPSPRGVEKEAEPHVPECDDEGEDLSAPLTLSTQ